MAENNSAHKGSIRTYLAQRGGSVEDAGGRGLTDEMARALGVDKPAALSAALGQMEADGVITREMRGLRTFRIALVDGLVDGLGDGDASAPDPEPVAAIARSSRASHRAGNMVGYDQRPPESAPVGNPDQPAAAVKLRDALSRKPNGSGPAPASVAPTSAVTAPGAAPVTAAVAVEPAAGDVSADTQPRRAVSLREAISQGATSTTGARGTARGAPATTTGAHGAAPGAAATMAANAAPESPPAPPAGRAVSLRDALAGKASSGAAADDDDYYSGASSWERTPPAGYPASLRDTARTTSLPPAGAAAPAWEEAGAKAKKAPRAKRERSRPRLTVPVPSVKSAPTTPIVTAVGIAVAGLVLVTVITIAVSRGSTHHVPATGTPDSSADACRVVTAADATTAFGGNAGDPHFVLGSCVYDDGTHELIVEVARQNGRALFDSSRSSSAKDIPGLGDSAYYADGRLRVLKGSTLMLMTMTPFNPDTPSPKLLALATTASGRL